MIFVNSIYSLQYYNATPPGLCYCDHIVYASDMLLQSTLNGSGAYSYQVYVYSADGLTQYEDASNYFRCFFGRTNSGQDYFTLQLKAFSPAMCLYACYILRVIITDTDAGVVIFDKYTERYCQSSCCDVPREITHTQDSITISAGGLDPGNPGVNAVPDVPRDECGNPLIRLTTSFTCVDSFDGFFFGEPATLLGGDYFDFDIVSNFKGHILPRPREIKRDVSYNCVLQRSESAKQYQLEGFEYFPAWKMIEIENQLHANTIIVSDFITVKSYQYDGGVAFAKPEGARDCDEIFKLDTMLRDCFIRQIFGCNTACNSSAAQTFIIPGAYQSGFFYDENLQVIGDYDALLAYYAQYGISTNIDIYVSASCGLYAVFTVDGSGYIPTSFYFSNTSQANRVFGQTGIDVSEYCSTAGAQCGFPQIGTITYADMACDAPVTGVISYSDVAPTECAITDFGYWDVSEAVSTSSNTLGQVTFDITTSRLAGEESGTVVYVAGEIIGLMGGDCRPLDAPVILDSSNNGVLPDDVSIIIDVNGFIYFYGNLTVSESNDITVDYDGLIYNQGTSYSP